MKQTFSLWEDSLENDTKIHFYKPEIKKRDFAIIIFAGGAYGCRSAYEDVDYAQFLNENGYTAFVLDYRISPNHFPLPLLDARRAVRFVRAYADRFGIDKEKILVMGSSAGGHLAALVSTYLGKINGEGIDAIDKENFVPNGQILCYPVISSNEQISHIKSYQNLLGARYEERAKYNPELLVNTSTPQAFIWHTASDEGVSVMNSYRYAAALRNYLIPCEMHIFPNGPHGLGLAEAVPYVSRWKNWLLEWLEVYFGD